MLDSLELVALRCVHGNGDRLSSANRLKVVCYKASLLVIDIDSIER